MSGGDLVWKIYEVDDVFSHENMSSLPDLHITLCKEIRPSRRYFSGPRLHRMGTERRNEFYQEPFAADVHLSICFINFYGLVLYNFFSSPFLLFSYCSGAGPGRRGRYDRSFHRYQLLLGRSGVGRGQYVSFIACS